MKIRVVELFAGVGGFRLGLEGWKGMSSSSNYEEPLNSNYEVVWSNQWEPSTRTQHANLVYTKRWGNKSHSGEDINTIANSTIPTSNIESVIPEHDLLVGGFPCQDYSVAGVNTNGMQGKKGVLWWNIHRILEVRRPKYVLLENVDRLLKSPTNQRGRDFAVLLSTMSDLGYTVEWKVINAADYGMPQRRRRVFIMGIHESSDIKIGDIKKWLTSEGILAKAFPSLTKRYISEFELSGSPIEITNNYSRGKFNNSGIMRGSQVITCDYSPDRSPNDNYSKFRLLKDVMIDYNKVPEEYFVDETRKLKRISYKRQKPQTPLSYLDLNEDNLVKLETELDKWKYLKGRKAEERESSLGIFYYTEGPLKLADSPNLPARTIITSEGGSGPSRFKHLIEVEKDKKYRRLTPIELERLNMFPDDHTKHDMVSDSKRAFFMGNALVVGVVEKIGIELYQHLSVQKKRKKLFNKLQYDKTDPYSIEEHAKKLINVSLRKLYGGSSENIYQGKGNLGQLVELLHYDHKPNSRSEPDFPEAGVELKTTPLKKIKRGLASKERLVLNIINYEEEHKLAFKESSFWKKNALLLLLFFLYEKEELEIDYIFEFAFLWRFPPTDLKIIIDDWKKIVQKIKDGKAHEISEGDTFYLGACTKGSTAKRSKRKQPFSTIPAQQRAYSIKSKYLNFIVSVIQKGHYKLTSIDQDYLRLLDQEGISVEEPKSGYGNLFDETEAIVKDIADYKQNQTIEELIIDRFSKYYGFSEKDLIDEFNLDISLKAKNKNYVFARAILGIKKNIIEEFEKGEIVIKTIKLESTGRLKESMSFAQIKYCEIIDESWEDSYLFNTLTKRFLFVIFQKDGKKVARLKKVMFWNMPVSDLGTAKKFWQDIRNKINYDNYADFWKMKDHKIFHVRPKGINSEDLMLTPQLTYEKKMSYWLNSRYIIKQLNK